MFGYFRCSMSLATADKLALHQLKQKESEKTKRPQEDSRGLLEQMSDIWKSLFSHPFEDKELKEGLLDQTKRV